jgi:uncharacterized protein YndB with AHSA1/START domain
MATQVVSLHRVFAAPPERVFKALTIPEALCKWMPPNGFVARIQHLDVRPGGTYKMSFINLTNGTEHHFGGTYLEVVPNERLVYSDKFDDPNLSGEMQMRIELRPVSCGTEVTIVQQGIPDVIPAEMCYLGWQDSLQLLALLVTPEINQ